MCDADEEKPRIRQRRGEFWPRPNSISPREGMAGRAHRGNRAAAHANKAMLYYYFGNKRRLHRAVLENLFRQLRSGSVSAAARAIFSARETARIRDRLFRFSGDASELPAAGAAGSHGGQPEFRLDRAPISAAVSQSTGANDSRRDCRRGISLRGSGSHGLQITGHDHFLFCRRADFERDGRAQSAGAASAWRLESSTAGFSRSWHSTSHKEARNLDDRPKVCRRS